jgi:hypothetical protein
MIAPVPGPQAARSRDGGGPGRLTRGGYGGPVSKPRSLPDTLPGTAAFITNVNTSVMTFRGVCQRPRLEITDTRDTRAIRGLFRVVRFSCKALGLQECIVLPFSSPPLALPPLWRSVLHSLFRDRRQCSACDPHRPCAALQFLARRFVVSKLLADLQGWRISCCKEWQ